MELVTKLPEDFLIQTEITEEQVQYLLDQINRFNSSNEKKPIINEPKINEDGKIILPKGTIIHGTHFNPEIISSISETGILTGQAVGIEEDCETYYCADFYRVAEEETIDKYNEEFRYSSGFTPFGGRGNKSIGIIIEPREDLEELLAYDCYRDDTKESSITKSFVNIAGLPLDKEKASSILYGVPRTAFSGIVLGDELFSKKEILEYIIKTFPNCYITNVHGDIIYIPNKDSIEIALLRGKAYYNKVLASRAQIEHERELEQVKIMRERINKLEEAIRYMINHDCSLEDYAKILLECGMEQGKIEDIVTRLTNNRNTNLKK